MTILMPMDWVVLLWSKAKMSNTYIFSTGMFRYYRVGELWYTAIQNKFKFNNHKWIFLHMGFISSWKHKKHITRHNTIIYYYFRVCIRQVKIRLLHNIHNTLISIWLVWVPWSYFLKFSLVLMIKMYPTWQIWNSISYWLDKSFICYLSTS